jgi:hypothetical protein
MIQVQVKATSIKAASVENDKRVSIKKAINRIIIEVKNLAEKRIILSAEDEKVTNL